MKPNEVSNQSQLLKKFTRESSSMKKAKFKIGTLRYDKVRFSKEKQVFEKGYTPKWSTEIFTIIRAAATNPVTYHLKDYEDNPITGGFYEQELLKAKYPDVYLVEKILKKRGKQVYLKWLGFDKSHNSWIDKT